MKFGFPQFLWALTALSIPLLIHLFNFRKAKTIFFSNTRFLKRLEQESKAIKRLRYWLIFAMRAIALSLVVMAFAQPTWIEDGSTTEKQESVYHIYVDNSVSMSRNSAQGPMFDQAKIMALDLLASLPENAEVQILANQGTAKFQKLWDKANARDLIYRMDFNPKFQDLNTIISRIRLSYEANDNRIHKLFLFSDFQESLLQAKPENSQAEERIHLLKLSSQEGENNLSIDSIHFKKPLFLKGLDQELEVLIHNYSESDQKDISLEFSFNDSLYSAQLVDFPALSSKSISIPFRPKSRGVQRGEISLQGGLPDFDNHFYFSFQNSQARRVYLISEAQVDWPKRIFKSPVFEFQQDHPRNLDYEFLESANLLLIQTDENIQGLVVNLKNHLRKGANIWLLPAESASAFRAQAAEFDIALDPQWTQDSLPAQRINYEDPFYQDVFVEQIKNPRLPIINKYLVAQPNKLLIPLLELSGGRNLISRKEHLGANVFLSQSSWLNQQADLALDEAIFPLIINSSLISDERPKTYVRIDRKDEFQKIAALKSGDEVLELELASGNLIPRQDYKEGHFKVYADELNLSPGHYPLVYREENIASLAVNHNPAESQVQAANREALLDYFGENAILREAEENTDLKELQAGISQEDQSLGASFIFAALLFLALEMLLLWKRTR